MTTLPADIAEFEYVSGQYRDTFPPLLGSFAQRSDAAAARADARLDIAYGDHPRQLFDLYPATGGEARLTLVYFHAGYWQSRDKSTFRFVADRLSRAGLNVAMVNYPLCPDVSVAQLVRMAAEALPRIMTDTAGLPMVLSGHSAGGHIAVELAAMCPAMGIVAAGVVGISGVYDLRDLIGTSLNVKLRLDANSASEASVVLRAAAEMPPALFLVGETETEAFRTQTRRMADAWRAAGNVCGEYVVMGADHFSILENLTDPFDPVHAAVLALAQAQDGQSAVTI